MPSLGMTKLALSALYRGCFDYAQNDGEMVGFFDCARNDGEDMGILGVEFIFG